MSEEIKNENTESFEELLEQSLKTLHTGEKVSGIITQINSNDIHVDLGVKQAGYILNLSTFKAAFNRHFLQKTPRFGQVIHIFTLFGRVIHTNLWIMWIILMQSFRIVFNTRSFCSVLVGFNKKIHNFPIGNHTADII